MGDKLARCRLGQKKHVFQVQVDDIVPIALGEVDGVFTADDACVVHQNVDATGQRQPLLHDGRQGGGVRQVFAHIEKLAAQGLHLRHGFGGCALVHAHDVRARLRQRQGHALAQAGVAAGHDGGTARQLERVQNHAVRPLQA